MKFKSIGLILSAALMTALLALPSSAAEGDSLWSQTYGGSTDDGAYSVIPSGDGGFLLAGYTFSFAAGWDDMWLVKVNAQGDSLWSYTYGGGGWDDASDILPAVGGFLLIGSTNSVGAGGSDIWLLKVNADGDSLWSHTYGGSSYEAANCLIPTGDGFLLAGWTSSFGVGLWDMWLVKVNAQGDSLWSHAFGGIDDEEANSIVPVGEGFLLAGYTRSFGAGYEDMWLVKVNAQGDSLWSRTYGASGFEGASSIIPSGDGGFLLAGWTNSYGAGGYDMWLVKVNAAGDSLWSYTYGGSDNEWASDIIPSGDGGFMLAGWTNSFGADYDDMWLVKVDADGDSLWSQTYGGSDDDWANSIISSSDGGFLLAGVTESFGAGDGDMWLVKVEGSGTPVAPVSPSSPQRFAFHPCRPNPFNPTVEVRYQIPDARYVSLKVYDTAGRSVAILVDSWSEVGEHQVTFDGSDLPSGLYFARLSINASSGSRATPTTATQKLVLLK